ncbi:MAG: hypothetical protein CND89_02700 [Marine Group II euryarchaeote MED-G38]|nr:hypothetical protein [Euryarchaeota archaeon]OUV26114.1 MAG: hypothetical protein CBC57_03290 [Euryarchaeota archaeon TMED97]PDH22973.1 MAG: hypothetical protein CND89_02700 [Marine Group II euryarchaeote MED-G38]
MGLLEKAGKIQTEDKISEEPSPVVASIIEPEPVKPAKKSRREKKAKTPKKVRPARVKKERIEKIFPTGFEKASKLQKRTRRLVDFIVSYGWSIPIIGLSGWGSNFNPTPFFLVGIILIVGNLVILPTQTSRSMGNWVSRTKYINSRGENPLWPYLFLKGITTVFVLGGIMALLSIPSNGGLGDTTTSQIFTVIGLLMIIPPLLDYVMFKISKDKEMGLWDRIFGTIWMVKTGKSAEAKGWLKRLESLGDFAESRGLLKENEDTE